ncbi:MAG: peptidylprolyl isomerase, partial [Chitinimonas sp.]|nr:peptidylprolyl isomerase [Chitinimonas sp.]
MWPGCCGNHRQHPPAVGDLNPLRGAIALVVPLRWTRRWGCLFYPTFFLTDSRGYASCDDGAGFSARIVTSPEGRRVLFHEVHVFLSRFQSLYAVTLALLLATPLASQATTVRLETSLGPVDIELYDTEAPKTVENFLGYVKRGDYNSSFMHRSVPGFVVQGGGFAWRNSTNAVDAIPTLPAVFNEFSTARLNKRGT